MRRSSLLHRRLLQLNRRHQQAARATALSLAVVFGPAAGLRAQTIDLAQLGILHPGFRIDGTTLPNGSIGLDRFGMSVSGAGDVNGDGFDDVIVGAPGPILSGGAPGAAYVVFGKADGIVVDVGNLTGHGFKIVSEQASAYIGYSVSGAGDVNGDGLDDLIVGGHYLVASYVPSVSVPNYVVFGKADDDLVNLSSLGAGGFAIDSGVVDDGLGTSVSGAGDVNGDGLADLIVGAPDTDSLIGAAYVVFGKANTTAVDLTALGSGGFRIDAPSAAGHWGRGVAGAGDVNGDGLDDLILGAPMANVDGRIGAGQACVVFGKSDSAVVDLDTLDAGGFRILGSQLNGYAGLDVSWAGDVNGDGLADVIVGAHLAGQGHAGQSHVVFGKSDSATVDLAALGDGGFQIDGAAQGDYAGSGVSGAGDWNGDGLDDVLIGAFGVGNRVGQCYVVFGKADGTTIDLASPGGWGITIDGAKTSEQLGFSVLSAGDIDGDGLTDIVLGSSRRSQTAPPATGRSYVVFNTSVPAATSSYLGYAVAGDAPRVAVGVGGGAPDTSSPASRCWIDFDAGDNGAGGASLQTVTLHQAGSVATSTVWEIVTNRTGWTSAEATLKYTDADITERPDTNLMLLRSDSLGGPYTEIAATVDPDRNTVTTTVVDLGFFALALPAPETTSLRLR